MDVGLFGSVGVDEYGLLARRELSAAGVDCDRVMEVPGETTVKYLVVDDDGEVMVLANDGVNEAFDPHTLDDETVASIDHLHLTGQSPDTAARLAERATSAGATASLDPGRRVCERDFSEATAFADYLFLNDRESECVAESLVDVAGAVVIKHGTEGGTVLDRTPATGTADGEEFTHPGYDIEPVDTAGAGDAFAAGFLAAVLDGAGHEEALAVANACGAVASQTLGARTDLSWDAVDGLRT